MNEKKVIPADERETTWTKSQFHLGDRIEIYTTDRVDMNKYEKLAKKYPEDVLILKDDEYGMTFSVPVKWLKCSPPRKTSEAQRAAAVEKMRKLHAARQTASQN